MTEAAVLDKPDEWNRTQRISGPPRSQLWDHYAVLFHPIEQAIKEAEKCDGPYRQTWKHRDVALPGERQYSVYAWPQGARMFYGVNLGSKAIIRGEMERAQA